MIKSFISFLLCLLVAISTSAQFEDSTNFSATQNHLGRYSTSQKDIDSKLFLPQYKDLASNPDVGVTLEDWKKSFLSFDRFLFLDKNADLVISKDELNQDLAMGEVKRYEQTLDDIAKYKSEFPEYAKQLNKLDPNVKPEEKVVFFLPVDMNGQDFPTKTYIQLLQGKVIYNRVSLPDYALLQLQDIQDKNSFSLHIYFFSFLVVLAGIIFGMLTVIEKKQSQA